MLVDEEVLRLQVDHQQLVAVDALQPGERVDAERHHRRLGQHAVLREQLAQVAARAVLGDGPQVVGGAVPRVEAQHVRVRQPVHRAHLALHLRLRRALHRLERHERDRLLEPTLVHDGEGAAADLRVDLDVVDQVVVAPGAESPTAEALQALYRGSSGSSAADKLR